jgi:hypothetical protein
MVRKHLLVVTSRKSDVKMDFTRKARWVKDGHKTPDSITSSYLVALMYAALLGLPVVGADIKYTYLQDQAQRNLLLYVDQSLALTTRVYKGFQAENFRISL